MHALRDPDNLHKIPERKVDLAIQGEKEAQQKLYLAEAEMEVKVGKSELWIILFKRSIKNSNLSDFD